MNNNTDLRILKTHRNIKKSFINLLLINDFKDITIQNILDEALIARSTFYDHYSDKYDLLNQLVHEVLIDFKDIVKGRFNLKSENDFRKFFLNVVDHYSNQRDLFLALLTIHTESLNFYTSLMDILRTECYSYLDKINITDKSDLSKKYISDIYASIAITSIQWYLKDGKEFTPQFFLNLFNLLKVLLP